MLGLHDLLRHIMSVSYEAESQRSLKAALQTCLQNACHDLLGHSAAEGAGSGAHTTETTYTPGQPAQHVGDMLVVPCKWV